MHCARCHDHKFDPISQDDYYALQAVFAGVDRANRSYEADPVVRQRRQMLLSRKAELESPTAQVLESLADPAVLDEVRQWTAKVEAEQGVWSVLEPITVESAAGATPTRQEDQSIVFGGDRPETDTYTLTAQVTQSALTAVRLEVLTDPSLPHQGPGRQDNGNLHLSEFQVFAAPLADPTNRQPAPICAATADFNQSGWTIEMAVDGNPGTAWGVHPEVGKSHLAVFEFQQPIDIPGGVLLTFVLEQKHGGGHLIGRPRLAVTTSSPPIRAAQALPEKLASALAVPIDQRNEERRKDLALHVLKLRNAEELAALPAAPMVYAAASDFVAEGAFKPARTPRPVFVLRRGDVNQPLAEAQPGAMSCLPGLSARFSLDDPTNEGARRAALAQWVTDPNNALTWRSIVNRVWHYHFGRGIVDSPNDLGHMGADADASRIVRLAGRDVPGAGRLAQAFAPPDPVERRVPAVVASQ